jgi:5,10-methylenetetrahydrofolate reductase
MLGDHKEAKGVFDLDSSQLLAAIRKLEKGKDLGGNDLDGGVSFCAGAIVTPEANPIEPQLIKFEKKIEAGAEFIQTQAVYDMDKLKTFMDYTKQFPAKILAGIILLTSAPMARFMNKNIAGVSVPQELIDEMASAPKGGALAKGIDIAGRMIKQIRDEKICDGVHIMAIGKEEVVPDIMAAAGLSSDR